MTILLLSSVAPATLAAETVHFQRSLRIINLTIFLIAKQLYHLPHSFGGNFSNSRNVLQTMEPCLYRVCDLPTELYDQIYDLVFAPLDENCTITPHYKPPAALQVNDATREQLAKTYYGKTTFFVEDAETCAKWLRSLTYRHGRAINDVRIDPKIPSLPEGVENLRGSSQLEQLRAFISNTWKVLGSTRFKLDRGYAQYGVQLDALRFLLRYTWEVEKEGAWVSDSGSSTTRVIEQGPAFVHPKLLCSV